MSDSGESPGDIFDVERIRDLIELMQEFDLREVDLRQSDQRIQLRRGSERETSGGVLPQQFVPAQPPTPPPAAAQEPAEEKNIVYVKSPMVGTFYAKANPEAEPFVKVGDHVNSDTVVCIVEAMKVFNEIPAEVSGKIVAVLLDNEEPVEFGKPLFKVDTGQ